MPPAAQLLSGFGCAGSTAAEVREVDAASLADAVRTVPRRGGIARGLGRSYGDAAQSAGGRVLRLASAASALVVDESAGTVLVGGGVSIDELLTAIVPRGWFVPVTPGTRFVTIGGAVASDIHGKNHHRDGSFGRHVVSLQLMTADGALTELGPDRHPDLFWATIGGMGLTGIVVEATLRMIPIRTSRMAVDIRRARDLDAVMDDMSLTDASARYSVAWIDLMARGGRLGRGVVTNADHAEPGELPSAAPTSPLAYTTPVRARVPRPLPNVGVITRTTVTAFNEAWFRRAPTRRDRELQSIATYFHPLDQLDGWNRVYGRRGFVQYQFVVPFGEESALHRVAERLSAARTPIFLAVLKRLGAGVPAPLSFPMPGWTLAVDIGAGVPEIATLLRSLDETVLEAGGRHYLAKDFHLTPAALRCGYPRLDEWLATRRSVDPAGVWASDQSRRLGLTGVTV